MRDISTLETNEHQEAADEEHTTCCIVGAGPAGALLALLLARKGVAVTLLEAHLDFEREFRGDTFSPASMLVMDEIGMVEKILHIPHSKIETFATRTPAGSVTIADFRRLKVKYPYIALLPQARVIASIVEEAQRYSNFRLVMGARAEALLQEQGVVKGVRYRTANGWHTLQADLTVGADGRFSRMRKLSALKAITFAVNMDVLWFRLSLKEGDPQTTFSAMGPGQMVVFMNRADHWQIGYTIHKNGYKALRAAGLEHLRNELARLAPEFADRVDELQDWKQISVLSVEADRLKRWHRPGLLLLGDAAHVMSPVAGVGINCAILDAVAAANLLAEKLKSGSVQEKDLAAVQRRRQLTTVITQRFQHLSMHRLFAHALDASKPPRMPFYARLIVSIPFVRDLPLYLIAIGLHMEHVK